LFRTYPLSLVVAKDESVMVPGGTHTPRLPMEPALEDAVIDVDALLQDGVTPSAEGKVVAKCEPQLAKSKAVAKRVPEDEIIDVDNPHKSKGSVAVASVPTSAVGSSAGGQSQLPRMKFDGALGVTLYEQKLDVMAQDAAAASEPVRASKMPPASGVAQIAGAPPSAHRGHTMTLGEAVAKAREEILAERVNQLNMPWPPNVAGMTARPDAPAPPGASPPHAASGAGTGDAGSSSMAPASALGGPSDARPSKVAHLAAPEQEVRPSKVARLAAVVHVAGPAVTPGVQRTRSRSKWDRREPTTRRKAAVMTVVRSVPRMIAYPPTPPPSGGPSHDQGSGSGDGLSGSETGTGDKQGSDTANGNGDDGGWVVGGGSGLESGGDADAAADDTAADKLAAELSARGHTPRLLAASCWFPGASAVLAAATVPHAGLPPIAPVSAPVVVPAGVHLSASRVRTSTPPPAEPVREATPLPPAVEEESSEDMDDDELVMAYVTPPASPAPVATPSASPRLPRPSSGTRRRAAEARTARRAAATTAAARATETQEDSVTAQDVLDALRSGLSSVRREITRFRGELVVVKSQAASTLRRVDGLAAAADRREPGSDAVLERLGQLDSAFDNLRKHVSRAPVASMVTNAAGTDSVALVAKIKVS